MSFPSFYQGKAIIAEEIKKWLSQYPGNDEKYNELCRRLRVRTGQGPKTVNKILEEDYGMRLENGELVRL